jgi:hypothetical protein
MRVEGSLSPCRYFEPAAGPPPGARGAVSAPGTTPNEGIIEVEKGKAICKVPIPSTQGRSQLAIAPARADQHDSRVKSVARGLLDTVGGVLHGAAAGLLRMFSDVRHGLWATIARPFRTVADVTVFALAKTVSTLLTAVGLEPKGRGLTGPERDLARRVFGPRFPIDDVEIKEGASVLSAFAPARTVGATIYVSPEHSPLQPETLVHEMVHVWQFMHGGLGYISESLADQAVAGLGGSRNGAYDFSGPIKAGKSWDQLHAEQQAELIETAASCGYFDSDAAAKHTRVIVDGVDYTRFVEQGLAHIREGRGMPLRMDNPVHRISLLLLDRAVRHSSAKATAA